MAPPEDVPQPPAAMVLVFSTASIPEGLLVKGLLESEDIPVSMKGEAEGPYRMGPVYLWVQEDLEARARRVIEDARSGNRGDGENGQGEET